MQDETAASVPPHELQSADTQPTWLSTGSEIETICHKLVRKVSSKATMTDCELSVSRSAGWLLALKSHALCNFSRSRLKMKTKSNLHLKTSPQGWSWSWSWIFCLLLSPFFVASFASAQGERPTDPEYLAQGHLLVLRVVPHDKSAKLFSTALTWDTPRPLVSALR